eukprot:COSAG01_NODE_1884_length_8988_cov_8.068624_6_plen_95_part_00
MLAATVCMQSSAVLDQAEMHGQVWYVCALATCMYVCMYVSLGIRTTPPGQIDAQTPSTMRIGIRAILEVSTGKQNYSTVTQKASSDLSNTKVIR